MVLGGPQGEGIHQLCGNFWIKDLVQREGKASQGPGREKVGGVTNATLTVTQDSHNFRCT